MRKIKVLHIIHKLAPGGAEAVVVNLVNAMNSGTIESKVCALVAGGVLKGRLHNQSVTLVELDKKEGNDPFIVFKLAKEIRRYNPDVVHTHCWGSLVEGYLASKLAGVSTVVHTEHGTIQDKYYNKFIQRYVWRLHNKIIAVSEEHRSRLSTVIKFPRQIISVVYNGVDTSKFKPNGESKKWLREQLGINEGDFCVGTIGRLEPVKDQATLIRAFSLFTKEIPESKLLLIGEGSLRTALTNLVESLKIEKNVLFLGYRADTPELLNVLDVFVLPSISEGTSCTLLEAMSTALSIIATNVGGNPEIIQNGKTGTLIPVRSPEALYSGLKEFYKKPERPCEGARRHIAKYFSIEKMVDLYIAHYLRLM